LEKPGRPLGVTLAILASVMLFSIVPLLQVGMILLVQAHFAQIDYSTVGGGIAASGGDLLGVPPGSLLLQGTLALIFLVIGVFAWRGRPAGIRFVMMGAVVLYTLIGIVGLVTQMNATQSLEQGISSIDAVWDALYLREFLGQLLVALYVLWYLNRAPARAFFRGYYSVSPAEDMETTPSQARS
jgi:hypothetical protein